MNRQLTSISILLAVACSLLIEEGSYLARHPFGMIVGGGISAGFSHCHPITRRGEYIVAHCDLQAYNSGLFMCKRHLCMPKEPANGNTITAPEQVWLDHSAALFLEESSPQNIAESQLQDRDWKP